MNVFLLPFVLALHAEPQAIILGGGKAPEDAVAWEKRWKAVEPILAGMVALAEGYPRRNASQDVAGLKAGFHVVLLGFCSAEELIPRLEILKSVYPGVYARPVEKDVPGACPTLIDEASVVQSRTLSKDGQRLVVTIYDQRPKKKEPDAAPTLRSTVLALLFDKSEMLAVHEKEDVDYDYKCHLGLVGNRARVILDQSCEAIDWSCGGGLESFATRTSYAIHGSSIARDERTISEKGNPECDQ